jgi:hypothetical protein
VLQPRSFRSGIARVLLFQLGLIYVKKLNIIQENFRQSVFLSLRQGKVDYPDRSFFSKRPIDRYSKPKKTGEKALQTFLEISIFKIGGFYFPRL